MARLAGGAESLQYSALKQITKPNVSRLEQAWFYPTTGATVPFNPVIVDGVMYVLAGGPAIEALDAATGKRIWSHPVAGNPNSRGINYWENEVLLHYVSNLLVHRGGTGWRTYAPNPLSERSKHVRDICTMRRTKRFSAHWGAREFVLERRVTGRGVPDQLHDRPTSERSIRPPLIHWRPIDRVDSAHIQRLGALRKRPVSLGDRLLEILWRAAERD